jgi:iron-sulfur cluster assembly protein
MKFKAFGRRGFLARARGRVQPETIVQMIDVTAKAATKLRQMVDKNNPGGNLRLGVVGGGCSGMEYKFKFDNQPRATDNVIEVEGIKLMVDPKSLGFLDGMILDYQESLMEWGFVFKNPNATKTCGCGKSFLA